MEGDLEATAITHHRELEPDVTSFSLCKIKKRHCGVFLVWGSAALVQANARADEQLDFAQNEIRCFVLLKQYINAKTAFTKLCKEIGKSVNKERGPFY
jgi:hypothetical protein